MNEASSATASAWEILLCLFERLDSGHQAGCSHIKHRIRHLQLHFGFLQRSHTKHIEWMKEWRKCECVVFCQKGGGDAWLNIKNSTTNLTYFDKWYVELTEEWRVWDFFGCTVLIKSSIYYTAQYPFLYKCCSRAGSNHITGVRSGHFGWVRPMRICQKISSANLWWILATHP